MKRTYRQREVLRRQTRLAHSGHNTGKHGGWATPTSSLILDITHKQRGWTGHRQQTDKQRGWTGHRPADRQTERMDWTQTSRQTDREDGLDIDSRQTDREDGLDTDQQTDRQRGWTGHRQQTDRQRGWTGHRPADRQTDRRTFPALCLHKDFLHTSVALQ